MQGRLGHGDIETTNKYLHVLEEADVEAAKALDIMLLQKPAEQEKNISWKQKSRPEPERLYIVLLSIVKGDLTAMAH